MNYILVTRGDFQKSHPIWRHFIVDSQSNSHSQYEAKIEALHQHAKKLADAISISEIEEHTVDAMKNTLGFFWGRMTIVEGGFSKFRLHTRNGLSEEIIQYPLDGPGIHIRAIKTGETQLVNDTREDPNYVAGDMDYNAWLKLDEDERKSVWTPRVLSKLDVPVKIDETVVATLGTASIELNAFSEQDKKLLETLASHVASAIQRIRLLEEQRDYEAKLEALHVHANKLADARSIEEINDHTYDAMVNTLGFMEGFYGSGSGPLSLVVDNYIEFGIKPDPANFRMRLDGLGVTVRAVNTGETQLLNDVRLDDDHFGFYSNDIALSKLDEELRRSILARRESEDPGPAALSTLYVPVKIVDVVVGVLSVESLELNAFTEQDQKLVETLASHIASAMQRIRNKEEMRKLAFRLNNLEPGGCYLSASHERCLKAYAVLSMEGVPGLCIVREDPQRLVDNYGISKDDIVLLSSRPFEDFETLEDLQSVSRALSRFLESGEGVVLLDGLEYLITRFGFDSVYNFVQEKRFDFLTSKAVLLVPLEMKTLDERQQALLSSEFTMVE